MKFVIGLCCRWAADMQKLKEEFESTVRHYGTEVLIGKWPHRTPETLENLQVNGTHWTSFLCYLNVGIPTTPIAVTNARSTSTSFRDIGFFFQSWAWARGCCSRYSSLSVKYRSACSHVSLWMKHFVSSSKNNSKNSTAVLPRYGL